MNSKKMRKLSILGLAIMILFASITGCEDNNDDSNENPQTAKYSLPVDFLINIQTTPEIKFGQQFISGDYSINDFCVMVDNSLLLLDSMSHKIYHFGDGKLIKTYDYNIDSSQYNFVKIATDSIGNIYIISAKWYNCFIKIDTEGQMHYFKLSDGFDTIDLASTSNFFALSENKLSVECYGKEKGNMINITVELSSDTAIITDILTDYYIVGSYLYIPTNILDPNDDIHSVGHNIRVEIFELNKKKLHDIMLASENWILGGKYYGKVDGDFLFELVEVDDNNNMFYYLALTDENGTIKDRYNLPLGGGVLLKPYNDELYLFVQTSTDIRIKDAVSLLLSNESGYLNTAESTDNTDIISPQISDNRETSQDYSVMGYITNFNIKNSSFDLDEIEWLTSKDDERLAELGISDLPGGFYIYNPDDSVRSFVLADKIEFIILNEEMQHESVDIEIFVNNIHDYSPYVLELLSSEVINITEWYVP